MFLEKLSNKRAKEGTLTRTQFNNTRNGMEWKVWKIGDRTMTTKTNQNSTTNDSVWKLYY